MTAVAYERENQLEGMICMHACTCAYTYSNLQLFFIIPDNALHIGLVTRSLLRMRVTSQIGK